MSPAAYEAVLDALAGGGRGARSELLEPARQRVPALLGNEVGGVDFEAVWTPLEQAVAALTEQFVIYVAGVTADHRRPLEKALSIEELHTLIKPLYALAMGYRLRLVHRGLFGSGVVGPLVPLPPRTLAEGRTMDSALKEIWREATALADTVVDDPETIESLRLRCPWYRDCHT